MREKKISQKSISKRNAELNQRCAVCGKKLFYHTALEAQKCAQGWSEAIKVK